MADEYGEFLEYELPLGCIPTTTDEPPSHGAVTDTFFEKHIKRVDLGGPPPRGERKLPKIEAPQHTLNDTEGVHRAIGAASIRR